MEYLEEYKWVYIITQVTGILILWAALKFPRLARLLFVMIFAAACVINLRTAAKTPEVYLSYAPMSRLFYANFINGWFKDHIRITVSLIAAGQGIIAGTMLLNKWWIKFACTGSIVFLLAIAPLGVGSGFPFSIIMCAAAVFIMKDGQDYLWKAPRTS